MADNLWRVSPELPSASAVPPADVGALGSLDAILKSLAAEARSLDTAGSATVNVLKNLDDVLAGLGKTIREMAERSQSPGNAFHTPSTMNAPVAYRSDVDNRTLSGLDEILKRLNAEDSPGSDDVYQGDDVNGGIGDHETTPTDQSFNDDDGQLEATSNETAPVSVADRGMGSIDPLAGVMGRTGSALNQLGKALGSVAAVAGQAEQTVMALGESMVTLVSEVDPAITQTLTSVEYLTSEIGQSLTPSLQALTRSVPLAVDSLASLTSQIETIGEVVDQSLDPVFRTWGNELRPLLVEITELMSGGLVAAMHALDAVALDLIPDVLAFGKALTNLVGMATSRSDFERTVATIPTSGEIFRTTTKEEPSGNVESALQAAQRSAFSLSTGAEDPLKGTFNAAVEIKKKADEIDFKLERFHANVSSLIESVPDRMWALAKDLPETIWTHLLALPGLIAEAIKDLVENDSTNKPAPGSVSGGTQQVRDWINRKGDDLRDWSMRNNDVSSLNPIS